MKVINSTIGIFIIIVGFLFINITIDNEKIQTIIIKILGSIILIVGIYYLKRIAKLGKQ